MRTTIDITDGQRARLHEIAASRGLKGFSSIVREAIDLYLEQEGERQSRIQAALKLRGALDEEAADRFEETARTLRSKWR